MQTRLLFLAAALIGTVASANPLVAPSTPASPLRATLIGETVAVRLQKDLADVDAVYEFRAGGTTEPRIVYFPLFAAENETPAAVLFRCGLELEFNGRPAPLPVPCSAPREIAGLPARVRVCWFAADLEALAPADAAEAPPDRLVLKARFRQPLLRGKCYYVPLIAGVDFSAAEVRSWSYQLHAHTALGTRAPRVSSHDSDYEPVGDSVTVYLRDGEVVVLE